MATVRRGGDENRTVTKCVTAGGIYMDSNIALTMRGICMTFPGVKALDNVDFTLKKGEIRALDGGKRRGKVYID